MKSMFIMLRPEYFWKYGSVDMEGNYPHERIEKFDIDSEFNYFIFKLNYTIQEEKNGNKTKKFDKATLYFCDDKDYEFEVLYDEYNDGIRLKSDYLGMYTEELHKLNAIECKPSKASGFIKALENNKDKARIYLDSLYQRVDVARHFKEEYDSTINGPSNRLIKKVAKMARR